MLVGKKSDKVNREKAWQEYHALKKAAGFETHALEVQLVDLIPTFTS
ncbi:MAG: hypothetical protein U5K75_10395 [Ahrensia sp.]|nr:hypothetical protein [Ahrensia sp.]